MSTLSGSIVALVTPLKDGEVDDDALARLVDWHIDQGTSALLPCGTTGESATFTHAGQQAMITRVVELANGRIPVIAGAGSNATHEAVALASSAKVAGASAILSVTPYYNKPPQEGLYRHYCTIGEACDLPVILYNVPGRTGCNLAPETAARIAESIEVAAVKEASGDIDQAQDLIDLGLTVLSGDDPLTFPMMTLGATGVVSVVANFAPRLMADLCAALAAGDLATARTLQPQVRALSKLAFMDTNPLPAKTAVAALGFGSAEFRLPLTPMSDESIETLHAGLRQFGVLS